MATATLASSNPSLSRTFFTFDGNLPSPGRPREASFSSYLSTAASADIFSLRRRIHRPGLSGKFITHNNVTSSVQVTLGSGRKKKAAAQDDELDVFGAEKYFSSGMDGERPATEPEKAWRASPPKEPELTVPRPWPCTPGASSASGGNSLTALLRDARRDRSRNPQRPPHLASKKFLGIFPCSCSDDSSVEVDKSSKECDGGRIPASRPLGARQARPELWCNKETLWRRADRAGGAGVATEREDYFSFPPVLNPVVVGNSTVGVKVIKEDQKMARISLTDVFSAPFLGKADVASNFRRSLTIINPFSAGAGAGSDDDVRSETSSDLFEIESLSTGTFPLGGAGGTPASTTCYEPSEVSIEWSVVTASAANVSVASDGDASPPKARRADGRQNNQRCGRGLLLGCGSAKAVSVASNTYRLQKKAEAAGQRHRHKSLDAMMPENRYHAKSSLLVDLEHGQSAHVSAARAIPRPVPVHLPHLQHPH